MIELPLSTNTAQVDPDIWATTLAPYVLPLIGGVSAIPPVQVVAAPASSPIVAGAAFAAVPGFSVSKAMAAGAKAMVDVVGSINLQYATGDIAAITLLRQIGTGPWVELTPAYTAGFAGIRSINADEMRPFAIRFLDASLALSTPQIVTYQLAGKSNNGNLWFGRRYDDAANLRSATMLTLSELA